jgi:hypothetical protein
MNTIKDIIWDNIKSSLDGVEMPEQDKVQIAEDICEDLKDYFTGLLS